MSELIVELICAECEAPIVLPEIPCPFCGCDETLEVS